MFFVLTREGQGAGPGVSCEGGHEAWHLCGDKQDELRLYGAPRGAGASSLEPEVWKCSAVLLQRVLGVLLRGALTGGKGVPGCPERLNMGLCVYIHLFIFKLKM